MTNLTIFQKVYEVVKKIPRGKVATYGQVAEILGLKNARIVGWALHSNRNINVPCHRVINREGKVAVNFAFAGGWKEHKRRLLVEGVGFVDEMHIDLKKHLWMGLANYPQKMQKCIKG